MPFFRTSWGVDILNSAIFNSFHNWVEFVTILESLRNLWGGGGFEPLDTPLVLRWVHTCNVTAYRNTVSWQCERGLWPRNVSKVGYAVTLRACSVRCRCLAVTAKGWYGYGRSRCGHAASRCTYTLALALVTILCRAECNARSVLLQCSTLRQEHSEWQSAKWTEELCVPQFKLELIGLFIYLYIYFFAMR